MSTETLQATAAPGIHINWMVVAAIVAVAVAAVALVVLLTGGGSDASPAGGTSDYLCRLGSAC